MSEAGKPLFLARRTYRHRRVIDASRLMPVVGGVLFLLPLLWDQAEPGVPGQLAGKMLYLFGVWIALVLVSGVIVSRLRPGDLAGPVRETGETAGADPD